MSFRSPSRTNSGSSRKDVSGGEAMLTGYLMGHSAFQFLFAGLELGLFSLLHQKPGLSRREIALRLGLENHAARGLLFGLAAMKLLRKGGEKYENSSVIEGIFQRGKADLWLKLARFQAYIVYPGEIDFLESLRSNRNVGLRRFPGSGNDFYARIVADGKLRKIFFEFMSAWSEESLPWLLQAVDFRKTRTLADIGGGDATISVGIATAFPNLIVQLMDSPGASSLARKRIKTYGLAKRIKSVEGDVFDSPFPSDCDCILFSHFLVIWPAEKNLFLLKKAYDALPLGGKVVLFSSMADDHETSPLFAALDSAYFLSIPASGGFIYPPREYVKWLRAAGFFEIQFIPCKHAWTPHGIITAIKRA